MNRYIVPSDEDFEPGSKDVLRNYLGITSKEDIEKLESQNLMLVQEKIEGIFEQDQIISVNDICNIHRMWLESIYPMAGKYRTVSMSKSGYTFASPLQIPRLMEDFEKDCLSEYTPCQLVDQDELSYALAVVHVEFILIHPFREGNGRIGRLLSIIMALQANIPPLNFDLIDQIRHPSGYDEYIKSIQAGISKDYQPLQLIFKRIVEKNI